MRFPVPQITTIMLLVHLGCGCCWHHAYTCAMNRCDVPAATTKSCLCKGHVQHEAPHGRTQHGRGGEAPHGNDETPHRHHCDGDQCSFVRSEPTPEQKGKSCCDLCPLEVALPPTKQERIHSRPTYGQDISLCNGGPLVRVHLRYCVLLI